MGDVIFRCILIVIISYLLGSISPAFFIGKAIKKDIRKSGSGNLGSTNVLRVLGAKPAVITFIIDVLKGFTAMLIGNYMFASTAFNYSPLGLMLAGIFVVIGHNFPFYLNFKGGKGIATTFGVVLFINPFAAFCLLLLEWVITLSTGYVSLASVINCALLPVFVNLLKSGENAGNIYIWVMTSVLGIIAIARHIPNIKRLIKGKENRFILTETIKRRETYFKDKDKTNE